MFLFHHQNQIVIKVKNILQRESFPKKQQNSVLYKQWAMRSLILIPVLVDSVPLYPETNKQSEKNEATWIDIV